MNIYWKVHFGDGVRHEYETEDPEGIKYLCTCSSEVCDGVKVKVVVVSEHTCCAS